METRTSDITREPCPDRILDDAGSAFAMGAIGGGAWHMFKGLRNSPNGFRLAGAAQAARMNAPRMGGSFGIWGTLFSVSDCTLVYLRQKEDPWNSILSGAFTSGFLSFRQGAGPMARSALVGGLFLALIEGGGMYINRHGNKIQNGVYETAVAADGFLSRSKAWFKRRNPFHKEEEVNDDVGGATIFERFDTQSPEIPSFDYK